MRNKEVDEMGDLRGRVHIAKQDLSKLQTRKVKALKKSWEEMDVDEEDVQMNGVGQETDSVPRKRRRNE
ncbi:rRNA-binding ribosome biosynthesis protein rpf2 [Serendipita sp. 411]|nr:rRNA-binding ribosome biosynthesis protein rpf2 [Serendipita sp. 411]